MFWFAPVPVLVLLATYYLLHSLKGEPHAGPFLLTLALIFLGYSGLGISVWPNIIPPDISIWEASGPPQSQGFALVGALLILPLILMYTAWSYRPAGQQSELQSLIHRPFADIRLTKK